MRWTIWGNQCSDIMFFFSINSPKNIKLLLQYAPNILYVLINIPVIDEIKFGKKFNPDSMTVMVC